MTSDVSCMSDVCYEDINGGYHFSLLIFISNINSIFQIKFIFLILLMSCFPSFILHTVILFDTLPNVQYLISIHAHLSIRHKNYLIDLWI